MEKYFKEILLDFSGGATPQRITAKQGDKKSRFIKISPILDNQQLTIDERCTVDLRCVKPDKSTVKTKGIKESEGKISFELPEQALTVAGDVQADIAIIGNNGEIFSSSNFIIEVRNSPTESGEYIPSEDYFKRESDIDMNNHQIKNLSSPVNNGDAATKEYVDGKVITVDSELSADSENPVKNKAIANSLSNAVKGKVIGEILNIGDISPIPHSLKIRAESKNLIDFNQIQNVGYAEPTIIENGFRLTGGYYAGIKNIHVLPNTKYYLSYTTDNISGTTKNVAVFADNNTSAKITAFTNGTGGYFDSGDCNIVMIAFYASASNTSETVEFTNIQLEYGTQSTEYKPYVDVSDVTVKQYGTQQTESEPIAEATVSENGTVEGLTSIYPNTVLVTNSENVTLECEYNRDLNKVINNIIDAVISLGGNV